MDNKSEKQNHFEYPDNPVCAHKMSGFIERLRIVKQNDQKIDAQMNNQVNDKEQACQGHEKLSADGGRKCFIKPTHILIISYFTL